MYVPGPAVKVASGSFGFEKDTALQEGVSPAHDHVPMSPVPGASHFLQPEVGSENAPLVIFSLAVIVLSYAFN